MYSVIKRIRKTFKISSDKIEGDDDNSLCCGKSRIKKKSLLDQK